MTLKIYFCKQVGLDTAEVLQDPVMKKIAVFSA